MSALHPRPIVGLALAGLLLAASCSDDNTSSPSTEAPSTTQVATTTPATTADPKKTATEVKTAFEGFFAKFAANPAQLEDGESMTAGIQALRSSERAPLVTVTVKDVKPLDGAGCETAGVPSPCAEVKFDLNLNGEPVVPDQNGYAVQQAGAWKVSKVTFCALAGLGSSLPPGC